MLSVYLLKLFKRLVRPKDEAGMAMITAILLSMVAGVLTVGATEYSLHSLNTNQIDRKQVQGLAAAEAGLDVAISDLTSTTPPCSLSGTLSSAPTTETYTVTITYYSSAGTSLNSASCATTSPYDLSSSASPATAIVDSTGVNNSNLYGARTMEAEVQMSAVTSPSLTDAVYSGQSMTMDNNFTVTGSSGNNANFYTSGNFVCNDSGTIDGSIYALGTFTQDSNGCDIEGSAESVGEWLSNGAFTLGGSIESTDGEVNFDSDSAETVGGSVSAHSSVVWSGATYPNWSGSGKPTITGTVTQNATLSSPATQAFPEEQFPSAESAWESAGYTLITDNSCSTITSDLASDISAMTSSTLFYTTCEITWNSGFTYKLPYNLAIVDTGGIVFNSGSSMTFESSSSTGHSLYLIVPYNATTTPGNCSISFTINGSTTLGNDSGNEPLNAFLYSPCTITYDSTAEVMGQAYSDETVTWNADVTMTVEDGSWPGATSTTGSTSSYTLSIVYEREVQ